MLIFNIYLEPEKGHNWFRLALKTTIIYIDLHVFTNNKFWEDQNC